MLDRLFMPALTFTLLVAATAAFATEFATGSPAASAEPVVVLERVVVTALRELPKMAHAEQTEAERKLR